MLFATQLHSLPIERLRNGCGRLARGSFVALTIQCGIAFFMTVLPAIADTQDSKSVQPKTVSVFEMPTVRTAQAALAGAMQSGDFDQATKIAEQLVSRYPSLPFSHYVLAMLAANSNDQNAAIENLERAVSAGYRDTRGLELTPAFSDLRGDPRFMALVERMKSDPEPNPDVGGKVVPAPVRDGVAPIAEANTGWDPRLNLLQAQFKFNSRLFADRRVDVGGDAAGKLLNRLFQEGKAAGNIGDLYDNRDRNHSSPSRKLLPQVAWLEYGPKAKASGLDFGLNSTLFYNAPTFGNSSVGVQGLFSVARFAMSNPRDVSVMYLQYRMNHLYVYPSVRDHAPFGYDAFPANTPYILVSRGKSGSDRPFLHAIANILAAFKPEVKTHLVEQKLLMPTVQMIFRRGQAHILSDEDYLSPVAHPTVFDGEKIDREKMIKLANSLDVDTVPPVVTLSVLSESDITNPPSKTGPKGVIFTTPSAIARVRNTLGEEKQLTVSAAATPGVQEGTTQLHWIVLEGDPAKVRIVPRDGEPGVVDISAAWQGRRPSSATPEIETDRIDIGVFAGNGNYYSAPAMISITDNSANLE